MRERKPSAARFAYEGLDRVMHERARLSLLTSLAAHRQGLAFAELKRLCGLTDGNLSRHLKILEEARLVEIAKSFRDGRPQTKVRLTAGGRKRFVDYLTVLESVVADAAAAGRAEAGPARRGPAKGGLAPA